MADLFVEHKSKTAILLVDISGSVGSDFIKPLRIIEKMMQVISQLGYEQYRAVFWNSPMCMRGRCRNGVIVLPFVIKPDTIMSTFAAITDSVGGGTCPSLGFNAIPKEWLTLDATVVFVTDGEIGCSEMTDDISKENLARCISQLPLPLRIIAVENKNRNFSNVEAVNSAAGGDVYALIQQRGLTGKVTRFESICPNGSTVQIDKVVKPPAGFVPYGSMCFSILRVQEFMTFIAQELKNADDAKQMAIAQRLTTTLEHLTKDKPTKIRNDIIRTFCRMFTIDANMVQWIITDAIEQEHKGSAPVLAHYRDQLKSLFQRADALIKQDVLGAIGSRDMFISAVVNNRVLTGSYRSADKTVKINAFSYPRGGFHEKLPVFPCLTDESKLNEIQDQCLRQWIRAVYGKMYGLHPTTDEIIFLVLGDMCRVFNSNASQTIKSAYNQLARCMLRKKRLNSMQTEMDVLLNETYVPNSGKPQDLIKIMESVSRKLQLDTRPLKLWYEICMALDPNVGIKQKAFCTEELAVECKFSGITVDVVPESNDLDYTCIVTLDDLTAVGGYKIAEHVGIAGRCAPVYLLSEAGKNTMVNSPNCLCPICYANLTADSFVRVGPKVEFVLDPSYLMANDIVERQEHVEKVQRNASVSDIRQGMRNLNVESKDGQTKTLYILRGVVGSGKSTVAKALYERAQAAGHRVYIASMDRYSVQGMSSPDAARRITSELQEISRDNNPNLVVIVDTCNERYNPKGKIFDVDFTGWKHVVIYPNLDKNNFAGYFAWSLNNVLARKRPVAGDLHYLNPETAGEEVCRDVHKKKAHSLFPKDCKRFYKVDMSRDELARIAAEYAGTLRPVEQQI